ncbi:hypothetical protein [Clavibacter zhangzhiyongii]|uniref:hypothetical protein n=1 Tax=Clavibacter zhangzhiyongii TaxID=2768071 RepID=UPI0039E067D8
MDSAWTTLIGVVVGAAISTAVPWVREVVTEKRRRREKRHDELTSALTEVTAVMALAAHHSITDGDERARAEGAFARFTLLTTRDEQAVVLTMNEANYDMTSSNRLLRVQAYAVFTSLLGQWHQGILSAEELRANYARDMPADRPARTNPAYLLR